MIAQVGFFGGEGNNFSLIFLHYFYSILHSLVQLYLNTKQKQ